MARPTPPPKGKSIGGGYDAPSRYFGPSSHDLGSCTCCGGRKASLIKGVRGVMAFFRASHTHTGTVRHIQLIGHIMARRLHCSHSAPAPIVQIDQHLIVIIDFDLTFQLLLVKPRPQASYNHPGISAHLWIVEEIEKSKRHLQCFWASAFFNTWFRIPRRVSTLRVHITMIIFVNTC